MKNIAFFFLLFFIFVSCKQDDEVSTSVFGRYQLTAIFSDPGDGNGEFNAVESNKTIILYSDSTYQSNFSFCNGLSIEASGSAEGTFSSSLLSITENCNNTLPSSELVIEFLEDQLLISYSCFEGCVERYSKITQ